MSRNGREIVYEFVFENEKMAEMAKNVLKNSIHQMIPMGMDKLAEELQVEQDGNKIYQKFIMKNEKIAECMFYLMKMMQGEET